MTWQVACECMLVLQFLKIEVRPLNTPLRIVFHFKMPARISQVIQVNLGEVGDSLEVSALDMVRSQMRVLKISFYSQVSLANLVHVTVYKS